MTFHQIDINRITEEARRAFHCDDRAVRAAVNRKQRDKDRKRVDKVAERFFAVMNGPNAPTDKQQAIAMMLPVWWLLLNILWQAFAEKVINWLWERTQSE